MALVNLKSDLSNFRTEFTTKSVVPSKNNVLTDTGQSQITSLNQIYKKFNLRDDASQTSYIQHPLILRGIQRKEDPEPQRWGLGIGDDSLIRGGAATALERSIIDTVRIGKWMASTKGLLWIIKQIGLGLSNPNVEIGPGSTLLSIPQTKVHTGLASLLSVRGTAFGLHFTRHGIPGKNESASYEDVINSRRILSDQINKNRLVNLTMSVISGQSQFIVGGFSLEERRKSLSGPQSVYGIGYTTINVSSDNQNKAAKASNLSFDSDTIKTYATLAYDKIPNNSTGKFNDFRNQIVDSSPNNKSTQLLGSPSVYTDNNIEKKYGFPELSKVDRSKGSKFLVSSSDLRTAQTRRERTIITNHKNFAGDKVNALDFYKDGIEAVDIYPEGSKDFIEFYFSDADTTINSVKSAIVFRAALTGLSDSFNPSWSKIDIMGRPDGAWIYSSYDRNISFTFTVAAQSRSEMIPIWRKLNYLASYTMPEYIGGAKPSGPFMRITIGNLFQQTPGFITSLTYTVPEDSPWDIAGDDDEAKQLPMYIEVSVSYTVISDFRPQKYGRAYSLSLNGNNKNSGANWLFDSEDETRKFDNDMPIKMQPKRINSVTN